MERVLLGMSGGVDSTASAIILKNKGYDVVGVTMVLCEKESHDVEDAKRVCDKIGIKHYVLDLKDRFREKVVNNFIETYNNLKTPNPCVECNRYIKFDAMFEFAKSLDINYVATGHYAKIEYSDYFKSNMIVKCNNIKKDQTYVLYNIKKEMVNHIIFPLSEFSSKDEIREIVKDYDTIISTKSDSQEICFIPNDDYVSFLLKNNARFHKGNIIDNEGNILAKHDGAERYTIGQRRGLGISSLKPMYVNSFRGNDVVVGEEKYIYNDELIIEKANFLIDESKLTFPMEINTKIRYSAKEAKSILDKYYDNKYIVKFDEKQRAITKGQSAVFYYNNILIGGGKIC